MNNQNKEEQRQLWISRVCEIEDSGLSQEEWCKSKKIPYSTLRYWVSKLKKKIKTEAQQTNWLKIDTYPGKDIATLRIPEDKGSMHGITSTLEALQ